MKLASPSRGGASRVGRRQTNDRQHNTAPTGTGAEYVRTARVDYDPTRPPVADELRAGAERDLADAAKVCTLSAELRGVIRIAIRSHVPIERIRLIVALANPELATADIFDDSHRAEYTRLGQPIEPRGLDDYAALCDSLRARIDSDELDVVAALELAATVARKAGVRYENAAEIAVSRIVRRSSERSIVDDATRFELGLEMFDRGWSA